MGLVKLFVAWSLDGYIARSDGGVDWLFEDQAYGMEDFMATVDTVVMGRKAYDVMEKFGQNVYEGKRNVVFSRSRSKGPDPSIEWVSQDAAAFVEDLKGGGDGIKLFPRTAATVTLNLASVETYTSGLLMVHYEVNK